MNKNNNKDINNKGLFLLIFCGLLTIAIIVVCVFFPEEFFGLFTK